MYYIDYMNQEFMNYLNRYLTGIILFKDQLEKISISYYLADTYSNHACRFYIDIKFFDNIKFSKNDKEEIDKYFFNSNNSSGSGFVSFIYKPQQCYDIDSNVIKSFIMYYQFAENIFVNTIQNILPPECELEILSLEKSPFFNYIISYIESEKYEQKRYSFSKRYTDITKRNFEFDCNYHEKLKREAVEKIENYTVSDVEINKEGGGNVNDLRWYILEKNIPFQIILCSNIINEIFIDEKILEEKIKFYNTKDSYKNINSSAILSLIKRKREEREKNEQLLLQKKSELNIAVGDYIFIENNNIANNKQNIGIVKNISLSYNNDLVIQYNIMNKNFTESKLPVKEIESLDVSFILKKEILTEKIQNNIKLREQLIRLFKEKGINNKMVKTKIKRQSLS